jgi:hypothetical protein
VTELENRLRAALAELADQVPRSRNAWAGQLRWRARTRPARRGPMLALAAAAVTVAATVPAVVSHPVARPPADPTVTSGYDPAPDGPWLTVTEGPVLLREFTESGRRWSAWVFLERHPEGTGWANRLCVVGVPTGEPVNGPVKHPNSSGCVPVHAWPAGQPPSRVETRSVLGGATPGSGPLAGLLLFVTDPAVSRLDACAGDGRPVPVRELGRTADLALFLADFGASYQGFCYTARDTAGTVIGSAIS